LLMDTLKGNKAQEEAIRTITGPVILISCPGSGKTTTLVRRINHMINNGVRPGSILMVTFTRDAASNMAEKYRALFGDDCGVTFATIHSLCFNILKAEGLCKDSDVLSESAKHDFLFSFFKEKGHGRDAWDMATNAATAISNKKNNNLEDIVVEGIPKDLFTNLCTAYESWCNDNGWIDYDDMLVNCRDILRDKPSVCEKYKQRFRFIQCDEYQDTNYIQRDILYLLAGQNPNLCVVGDDDQSIYAFRGAKPEIMLKFQDDYPSAKVIYMGTNYRSCKAIVTHAGNLIANNRKRFKKDFLSERGEAGEEGFVSVKKFKTKTDEIDSLIKDIQKKRESGVPYKDIAVLFRTNKQVQSPVLALARTAIPYYSTESTKSIYESFMFSDITDYVLLSNGTGNDRNLLRVLNHPNRFLRERAFKGCAFTFDEMAKRLDYILDDGGSKWKYDKAIDNLDVWMQNFGPGKIKLEDPPKKMLEALNGDHSLNYDEFIKQYAAYRNLDLNEIMEQYDGLCREAMSFATIGDWFDHAKEFTQKLHEDLKKKDKDGVMLTTMHRAKGLEWKVVYIIDANEGITPHNKSQSSLDEIEEERRLFYVAMTRAKDELNILSVGDKPSRFIAESLSVKPFVEESKRKVIPKKMAGAPVLHKTFGGGTVVCYEPGLIVCVFKSVGEKKIQFPETFQKGIIEYL